ncbi:bcl-2-related ovarian killer protein isoform X2 [Anabrus simplex]|uniref:bcl-2-related ovarian killer protein isoform X2 n=1 Tax=Anabrus simplex TaxID=316456 RepID=UPI0034DCD0FF
MSTEPAVAAIPAHQRRKFSFPASLHSNLLLGSNGDTARRRFSNVSDAVSRKLSHTIGWRTAAIPTQDLVEQGRSLCSQYIRSRLKRAGLFNRKCGLQRLRTAVNLPGGFVVREVFPELVSVGLELERMHPKLYSGVARQASGTPGGVLVEEKAPGCVLSAVARELFKADITWGKVVSLFAVAGGLAVDCVRQGHPDYLQSLPEAMGELIEDELAPWIVSNGGWGLGAHYKPPDNEAPIMKYIGVLGAIVVIVLVLVLTSRFFF